jgi:hypothetical protein
MRVTIKILKKKKNCVFDVDFSDRLSAYIEKQDLVVVIDKFYKFVDKISKL